MLPDETPAGTTAPLPHALQAAEFVAAVAAQPSLLADPEVRRRHDALLARSSVCSYCGVGCPYTVETDRAGRDKVVPLSPLGLCVKGSTSIVTGGNAERRERLAARGLPDDRIRAPMIRGHDGRMHEVSWEEALDRAAWLFLHAREWVGPDAVALYGNGQKTLEAIWLACLYKLVFRLPTIGANSEHCLASAGAAHELNFGNEASFTWQQFEELASCDVAVLHGTNAFVTFPQAYEKLKRNSHAIKVVIDPVRTDTVSDLAAADPRTMHIAFRQGGDVLFNLAVAREIVERGWEDRAFLDRAVDPDSRETLYALCRSPRCEVDEVARHIALPGQDPRALAETIRSYARLIAEPGADGRPRVAFVSSMGINQSTGSYGFSSNLNLLLLTGNVGRPGAGSLRIAGQSNATSELMMGMNARRLVFNLDPTDARHRDALARVLELPVDNIPAHRGTSVSSMADDDRLYCFLFVGTQMTRNMPRLGHWSRRLGRAFNVVIDCFLGEGVLEHADVLLPALTYTERTGVIQRGDRTLQLQQPLSAPPPLAWSDTKILGRLALRIAERLRDPDTAALNDLDPDVVHRSFARYFDADGEFDDARAFDHIVEVSRALDVYCRLEDAGGVPISHDLLRARAGTGVQWGGNGRYRDAGTDGAVFPRVDRHDRGLARLVRPPDAFLDRLDAPLPAGTVSLISGRGRPGRKALKGRGRYNSGVKTLPIYGPDPESYDVEVHPDLAARDGLSPGQPVRLVSAHGAVVASVHLNDRVPQGTAFIDFVPGQINRLTDYVEADGFTSQSLIKRTPIQLSALRPLERALWEAPDADALAEAVQRVFADYRRAFPTDEDWVATQRGPSGGAATWLPPQQLRAPEGPYDEQLSEGVGALSTFFQRYVTSVSYRTAAASVLRAMDAGRRDAFLRMFLPLVRRLDHHDVVHPILADLVGAVTVVEPSGARIALDLLSAHKSAVLEFKEEIVAIQLYVAAKRAIELLFGEGAEVARDDLAFVSGVAIPCAGDVPAHFMGISPAQIGSARLVHSRAIGNGALIVADRRRRRAVRIEVLTGVLPADRELTKLRGVVINRKRAADTDSHRRFFDRLGELIVDYVRTGDDNFKLWGPVDLDWEEYRAKLSFAPAHRAGFGKYLVEQKVSAELAEALVGLGVLETVRDAEVLDAIRAGGDETRAPMVFDPDRLYAGTLSERVDRVLETILQPVLANDGGRLDILRLDEDAGVLHVRFVGSCANCPYSLLSMEQIVKPTLMAIPGIRRVDHRARARDGEVGKVAPRVPSADRIGGDSSDAAS